MNKEFELLLWDDNIYFLVDGEVEASNSRDNIGSAGFQAVEDFVGALADAVGVAVNFDERDPYDEDI